MGVLDDVRQWLKEIPLWRELEKIPHRTDELEARVSKLEKLLEAAPGDLCPKCGMRAMRLSQAGRLLGGKDAYRFDQWSFTAVGCDYSERRKVSF